MRIQSNLFNVSVDKIWISTVPFFDKGAFLKILNAGSLRILDEYFTENFLGFYRKKSFHLIFYLHNIFLCILDPKTIKWQLSSNHSIEGDPKAPYVDHFGMVFLSFGKLWGCIRGRSTKSGAKTPIFLFRHKSKINKLSIPIMIEHDIFALDISMENSLRF